MVDPKDRTLVELLQILQADGYRFVTPTPETHARWLKRARGRVAASTREVLGWNLPFVSGALDAKVEHLLREADALAQLPDGTLKARVRVSSLDDRLYLHSAFPTEERDAVFLGPDSYRFANLIKSELDAWPPRREARVVDIGTGAGVGAMVAAAFCEAPHLFGSDINPAALRLAACNFAAAAIAPELILCGGLDGVDGDLDLILANPPYIVDEARRSYRDGGGMHGSALSLAFATAGAKRLAPGGRMIVYTGSAIVQGVDAFHQSVARLAAAEQVSLRYWEIDPDVFGEELDHPPYIDADRIAVVAAVLARV